MYVFQFSSVVNALDDVDDGDDVDVDDEDVVVVAGDVGDPPGCLSPN